MPNMFIEFIRGYMALRHRTGSPSFSTGTMLNIKYPSDILDINVMGLVVSVIIDLQKIDNIRQYIITVSCLATSDFIVIIDNIDVHAYPI